jgi:hypothetical protein
VESPAAISAISYVRQARRLRAALAQRPAELHQALRNLSEQTNAAPAAPGAAAAANAGLPSSRAALFAEMAASRMQGDLLSYSGRLALMRAAQGLGIDRFQANLIIAAVQHQNRSALPRPSRHSHRRGKKPLAWLVVALVLIELLAALAIWQLLLH